MVPLLVAVPVLVTVRVADARVKAPLMSVVPVPTVVVPMSARKELRIELDPAFNVVGLRCRERVAPSGSTVPVRGRRKDDARRESARHRYVGRRGPVLKSVQTLGLSVRVVNTYRKCARIGGVISASEVQPHRYNLQLRPE